MTTNQLNYVAEMTDINAHGEAREYIANQYAYCKDFLRIIRHINAIHFIVGNIPHQLDLYRAEVTREMLNAIKEKEGQEKYEAIYACL